MGIIGVTLIVGAVLFVFVRPQSFIHYFQSVWGGAQAQAGRPPALPENGKAASGSAGDKAAGGASHRNPPRSGSEDGANTRHPEEPPTHPPSDAPPLVAIAPDEDEDEEQQTTPRAGTTPRDDSVPTFLLSSSDDLPPAPALSVPSSAAVARAASAPGTMAPPPRPGLIPSPTVTGLIAPPPRPGVMAPPPRPGNLMAPPPLPSTPQGLMPPPRARPPTLSGSSSASTLSRSTLPIPSRGPSSSSSLAPPPTNSTKTPANRSASRLATLEPGHSPMDWARISGPTADLRGLPPSTPYLRVTPSMLRQHTGRKGTDAWSAFGGRVYNISPYIPFHPGGKGELLRGAGKDGTRLFAEIHPWVNYETMLAACLVGILVDEEDGASKEAVHAGAGGVVQLSAMEEMD